MDANIAPDAGDEAVAFTAAYKDDELSDPTRAVVFRHGSAIAQFSAANANAVFSDDWDFPTALVDTQEAKPRALALPSGYNETPSAGSK
ncbi:hypothetical protein [Streptomyces sp. WM6386]|uniref:hypothetical protein n=1 Tax=Streptomyces sp. WM6386 TaxID=1415558 RepID=UPI0006193E63|nr:hypothetical protein [Streptomyces sp. WM6386]KKD08673.1 hypothetical protein TN53_07555 [Streptomyces sp. WM6386]